MDSSSDEEDDHHNLLHQNDTKPPTPRFTASPFHIDNSPSLFRRFNFTLNKTYILAILILLIILFIYFMPNLRSHFPTSSFITDPLSDRMKESELQAINLLRQQQLGLLTALTAFNRSSQFNASDPKLEDLKSALFKQISINREIQQVLLDPHRIGNSNSNSVESGIDFGNVSYDRCRTVDENLLERKTVEWNPKEGKFLLAICVSGQMSNHLICLEKHMFFAALLNRVLVIPSSKVDYQFDRVIDIDHINKCLGKKVVISFEEFSNVKKDHLHIDKFLCYFSLPQPCYLDDEKLKKLRGLGLSMSKPKAVWDEDTRNPKKKTVKDVLSKFAYDDDVMAIGDVFFAEVEKEWLMQPGGPIAHKCKTLIEPSRLILLTAQRFIQTFLGRNFIALHFRRHGFLKFWCDLSSFFYAFSL